MLNWFNSQHVLKTCWDGLAKDELMKRLVCGLQERLGSSVSITGITDSNFQFVRENTSIQRKKLWYPQVECTNEAKRIFNHIHWDHIMMKSFTFWEIPSDNFQFIWIQSNVLLLTWRNEQHKEFIAGWLWPGWDRCLKNIYSLLVSGEYTIFLIYLN